MNYQIDTIPLDAVRINGGTQSRAELNQTTIAEYAEAIRAAVELPPVVTFFDGSTFWLADGFHRFNAHRDAGAMEISAEIRTGTQRDAILYSVGANASHGLRRTNEDKRRAVETLLGDAEWSAWSQERIAKACGVSTGFVSKMVNDASIHREEMRPTTRTVERNGTTYEQNTVNIGKARPAQAGGAETATKSAETRMDTHFAPAPKHDVSAQDGQISASTKPLNANGTAIDFPAISAGAGSGAADAVHALRDQLAEVSEALKSTLADNEMMGRVFDADDRIKAAMGEAIRQKAIAENAERTLAAKNGEFIERARAVTHWMNRAQKAEKTLAKLGAAK